MNCEKLQLVKITFFFLLFLKGVCIAQLPNSNPSDTVGNKQEEGQQQHPPQPVEQPQEESKHPQQPVEQHKEEQQQSKQPEEQTKEESQQLQRSGQLKGKGNGAVEEKINNVVDTVRKADSLKKQGKCNDAIPLYQWALSNAKKKNYQRQISAKIKECSEPSKPKGTSTITSLNPSFDSSTINQIFDSLQSINAKIDFIANERVEEIKDKKFRNRIYGALTILGILVVALTITFFALNNSKREKITPPKDEQKIVQQHQIIISNEQFIKFENEFRSSVSKEIIKEVDSLKKDLTLVTDKLDNRLKILELRLSLTYTNPVDEKDDFNGGNKQFKNIISKYNDSLKNKSPEIFENKFKAICLTVANTDERFQRQDISPLLKENKLGEYWLVNANGKLLCFPCLYHDTISDGNRKSTAIDWLFETKSYPYGAIYSISILDEPAELRKDNNQYSVAMKGKFKLSNVAMQ